MFEILLLIKFSLFMSLLIFLLKNFKINLFKTLFKLNLLTPIFFDLILNINKMKILINEI